MKKLILFTLFMLTTSSHAAGTVDFLEVDNDVVLFSTSSAKTAASPACVASETAHFWTVSLASDSGRAIYSLILTSMAKGDGVTLNIESAQDCADKSGIERARKVNLVSMAAPAENSASNSIGLYKADGQTRIGTVLSMGPELNSWYYASDEASSSTLLHQNEDDFKAVYFYFMSDDCTGVPYISSHPNRGLFNPNYDNGKLYFSASSYQSKEPKSYLHEFNGRCYIPSVGRYHLYSITPYNHAVCGAGHCLIKQD